MWAMKQMMGKLFSPYTHLSSVHLLKQVPRGLTGSLENIYFVTPYRSSSYPIQLFHHQRFLAQHTTISSKKHEQVFMPYILLVLTSMIYSSFHLSVLQRLALGLRSFIMFHTLIRSIVINTHPVFTHRFISVQCL